MSLTMKYFLLKPEAKGSEDNWHHGASRFALESYATWLECNASNDAEACDIARGIREWLSEIDRRRFGP